MIPVVHVPLILNTNFLVRLCAYLVFKRMLPDHIGPSESSKNSKRVKHIQNRLFYFPNGIEHFH
jgi:hypothetical protein